MAHSEQAVKIYEQIMRWLEGPSVPSTQILRVRVKIPPPCIGPVENLVDADYPVAPETEAVFSFRRGAGFSDMKYADSLDREGVRIYYDPNWEALAKIERLLAEV